MSTDHRSRALRVLLAGLLANTLALAQNPPPPEASFPSGLYEEPITVELSSIAPGGIIRYTTDSSPPSGSSPVYEEPLLINTTTVVRALVGGPGGLSPATTKQYLFMEDVLAQPNLPAGAPATWGGFPAFYRMDPSVVNDPEIFQEIRAHFHALPLLLVTMDPTELFGPAGLYANPQGQGREWEFPCHLEYRPSAQQVGFALDAGIRISGGFSRQHELNPKKSFRFYFRGDYGKGRLRFDLFGGTATAEFDKLLVRAGYNNTWVSRSEEQRVKMLYVRDAWTSEAQRAMGWQAPHLKPVHLFFNGIYWGIYQLQEQLENFHYSTYFGGGPSDWDVIKHQQLDPWPSRAGYEIKDGDSAAWDEAYSRGLRNLANTANYESFGELVDVVSLADYMLLNTWGGNNDGPVLGNNQFGNNWFAARRRVDGEKFQFTVWDSEWMMLELHQDVLHKEGEHNPATLFQALRRNPEFRLLFADRAHLHLQPGGALSAERNQARLDSVSEPWSRAIHTESARWGGYRVMPSYTREDWLQVLEWVRHTYLEERNAVYLGQLRAANLFPAIDPPLLRVLPEGDGLTGILENPNGGGEIYYTLDGSDPREPGGQTGASAILHGGAVSLPSPYRIIARIRHGNTWSARLDSNAMMGQAFSLPAPWNDLARDAHGMFVSSWFGRFYSDASAYPLFHHEDHGWVLPFGDSLDSIWIWDFNLEWVWTGESAYPFLWSARDQDWLYYHGRDAQEPFLQWYYHYGSNLWDYLW